MTPRERVLAAFAHQQPDFTPCDYFATPEIHEALLEHFSVGEDADLRERLGTDIRYVAPPYVGPPLPTFDDGSTQDIWGVRRRPMPNEYGEYAEPVGLPYAKWKTVADADGFPWPDPDWFDYAAIGPLCERFPQMAVAAGHFNVQDFINATAFGRGVEQVLIDMAVEDPVFLSIVERRHRFYLEHIERILDAAAGRIDLVLCGDDFGSQRGLLISPNTFNRLFGTKKREFFDLVHSYGAKVTHHCCGSSRQLIPDFIDCGMDALQTIQPQAHGMDPYELKQEFNGRIVLHGAVDVQGWLQRSSPAEVEEEVNRLMDEVGQGGGFVLAPCHQIQPDTPIENVLALYGAVAARRGKQLGGDPTMSDTLNETVLQFGTGKFLRAFVDLFVQELNQKDTPVGRVVVVQSTGGDRAKAFGNQDGRYHVALRGLKHGRRIDETIRVESVARALIAADSWPDVLAVGRGRSLEVIVSNTTEAGYALDPEEKPADEPPRSFPGKLLSVLKARFEAGMPGVSILPCELLDRNAERLLDLVVQTARRWELSGDLTDWIGSECSWHNTLVDRIVSAPSPDDPLAADDPLFAVAEPFALWLVEGNPRTPALMDHPAIQQVDDLEPYHLRKVRILNGAHTALVAKALPAGFEIVREAVLDPEIGSWLKTLLFDEIVPTLAGRTEDPGGFAREALERFANPFLDHRLADIALHHDVKIKTRLAPTYDEFQAKFGKTPPLLEEVLRQADNR